MRVPVVIEVASDIFSFLCITKDHGQTTNTAVSRRPVVICEIERGQSWYFCERARHVREPRLRASWRPRAGLDRDDGPPDGDDARRRGGERPPDGDAHPPDASVTVPFFRIPS